jgi:hypothetical protein
MKKLNILVAITFLINNAVYSQVKTKTDIQIPSTPGMSIIGIQNSEITKPGNYTGLYTSLISPIVSNNGTIPTDLSLEFSPYYLESRDVTYKELSKTDVYRDMKISIASNKVNAPDSSTFSRVGIGFRTNLLAGDITVLSRNKITLAVAGDIETTINIINSKIYGNPDTADINKFIQHISDKDIKRRVKKVIELNKNDSIEGLVYELNVIKTEIEHLIKVDPSRWDYSLRTGHFLELAGAFAIDFPKNTIDYSKINRWGIWLNYTYRPKTTIKFIDFGAILRISNYSFDPTVIFDNKSIFSDFGASINVKIPNTKFVISGEMIGKYGLSDFKATENSNQYTFKSVSESKWSWSIGYVISDNILWSTSLSEISGNSDYLKRNSLQFLMGLSVALVPMKQ